MTPDSMSIPLGMALFGGLAYAYWAVMRTKSYHENIYALALMGVVLIALLLIGFVLSFFVSASVVVGLLLLGAIVFLFWLKSHA